MIKRLTLFSIIICSLCISCDTAVEKQPDYTPTGDGDYAADPFIILTDGSYSYDTSGFANDYNEYDGNAANGKDITFRKQISAGKTLTATLSNYNWDTVMAISTNQVDIENSCVAYIDAGSELTYTNSSINDIYVYIMVDGFSTNSAGSFTITFVEN